MKKWIRRYGVHGIICVFICMIAFVINVKVNINKMHTYTVSTPVYTLMKEIKFDVADKRLFFQGWGFDVNYYNESSVCELILQETETKEAIWIEMEKNPESQIISQKYTYEEDYSGACFEGSIEKERLNEDSVYELLLRYTTEFVAQNGKKEQYVKTVTTDKYIYQGKMTVYNPKTFEALKVTGTKLEKVLAGSQLFHYFQEGMWVYYDRSQLYYILTKELVGGKEQYVIPVQCIPIKNEYLPEMERERGFTDEGFYVETKIDQNLETEKYVVMKINIPTNHAMYFVTGLYKKELGWILQSAKQFEHLGV